METTIIEDEIFELGLFEEDGSVLMAAETPGVVELLTLFLRRKVFSDSMI